MNNNIKENDWFAATLFQPELTPGELYSMGVTPDNSKILSRDDYKNIPEVREKFTEKGVFNDLAFNNFYDETLKTYNQLAFEDFDQRIAESFEYDPDDWRAPIDAPTRDVRTTVTFKENPYEASGSITTLGAYDYIPKSTRELAQANKVHDYETGETLDWTPNDMGGLFKSLKRPNLVLAAYDEDTPEHKKGELKYDENGLPYYETLGNRESYDKDVLHIWDTLTVDGSKWNKFDLFDSDGLEEKFGKTTLRTALKVTPYLIKGFNMYYGGITAALSLAQMMPTLGKSVNGIISDNNSKLGQELTKAENWLTRFDPSTSDKSRNKIVTWENFGNLISDVSEQLFQQRAVAQIPQWLNKHNIANIDPMLGRDLSLGYMAIISSKDVYKNFKNAGANDATAGIGVLGYIATLDLLMNQDYYKKFLFKGSFLANPEDYRKASWSVAQKTMGILNKEGAATTVEANRNLLKKVTGFFKKDLIPTLDNSKYVVGDLLKAGVAEGTEEVMEEVAYDVATSITKGAEALGIKVSETGDKVDFNWNLKNAAERYAVSFVGGFIGGEIFHLQNKFNIGANSSAVKEMDDNSLAEFTWLLANNRGSEIRSYYKKLHDKGKFGNTNLDGSKFEIVRDSDGNEIKESLSTEQYSQNDVVYNALIQNIDYIESLLGKDGLLNKDDSTIASVLLNAQGIKTPTSKQINSKLLEFSLVNGGFLNELNHLAVRIVKARAELDSLIAKKTAGETDHEQKANSESIAKDEDIKAAQEKLKALKAERDSLLSGENLGEYVGRGLFVLDENTSSKFINLSKELFTQTRYGKNYNDLSDDLKKEIDNEYTFYQNTEGKNNYYRAYDVYRQYSLRYADQITELGELLKSAQKDPVHNQKLLGAEFLQKLSEYNTARNRITELSRIQNRSEAEETELQQLKEKIDNLDFVFKTLSEQWATVKTNPEVFVQEENTERNVVKDLNSSTNAELAKSQIGEYILNLYDSYIANKSYVRSEDELAALISTVKKEIGTYNFDSQWDSIFSYMVETLGEEFMLEQVNKDDENPLFTTLYDATETQKVFKQYITDIYNNIGTNLSEALKLRQDTINFIVNNSNFTEEQAAEWTDSFMPHIDIQGKTITFLDYLTQLEAKRSQVILSPIKNFLSNFYVDINGTPSRYIDLIDAEIHRLSTLQNIGEYSIFNPELLRQLKQISSLVDMTYGMISGAYNNLNSFINSQKSLDGQQLPIIESGAELLFDDLEVYANKVNLLIHLAEHNTQQKLKTHKVIACNCAPKFVKYIIDSSFSNKFASIFNLKESPEAIWNRLNSGKIDLDNVQENEYADFEFIWIQFQDALYDAVKDNNIEPIKILELFDQSQLYKLESTKLSPDTKSITGFDIVVHLFSMLEFKASDFYSRYKNIIGAEDFPFAPILSQELAIRNKIAYLSNVTDWNNLLLQIKKNMDPAASIYEKNKIVLRNFIASLGSAGVGKTTCIAYTTLKMLEAFNKDVEFIFAAPNIEQAKKLAEEAGYKDATILDNDSLMSLILENGEPTEDNYYVGKPPKTETKHIHGQNLNLSKKQIFSPNKKVKVLVLDEVTLFNEIKLRAISGKAVSEGFTILALGDLKQNSSKVGVKNGNQIEYLESGLEDCMFIKSPELTATLRADNIAQFDNAYELSSIISTAWDEIAKSERKGVSDYSREVNKLTSAGITIKYFENDKLTSFVGTKFVKSEQVSRYMSTFKDLGSVALITDKKYAAPEGVTKIDPNKAQGGEFDYVIIDIDWDKRSDYTINTIRQLYTLTQRSRKGTIAVDNGIIGLLHINNKKDASSEALLSLNTDEKSEYKEWRMRGLTGINIDDSNFTSYFKLQESTETPVTTSTEPVTQKTPTTNPPTPVAPTQPASPTYGQSQSGNNGTESESKGRTYNPTEERPVKPIKLAAYRLNEESFYRWWHSSTLGEYENSNPKSIISYLKANNLKINTGNYRRLISLIAGYVKSNEDSTTEYWQSILREISFENLDKNLEGRNKLFTILNSAEREIWIQPYQDTSIIVARFKNGDDYMEVPIGFTGLKRYGRYNGKFTLLKQVQYPKGSDNQNFMTLEEFQAKYPGIIISDEWGVIRFNLANYEDIPENLRTFVQNNGKVFAPIFDNAFLELLYRNNYWIEWETEEGYTWLHDAIKESSILGVHRALKASDIIKYAYVAYNYRHNPRFEGASELGIPVDYIAYAKDLLGTSNYPVRPNVNASQVEKDGFFKEMSHSSVQILSDNNTNRLLLEYLKRAAMNDAIGDLALDSIMKLVYRIPASMNSKGRVPYYRKYGFKVRLANGQEYVLTSNGVPNMPIREISLDLWDYRDYTSNVGRPINSYKGNVLKLNLYQVLKSITPDLNNIVDVSLMEEKISDNKRDFYRIKGNECIYHLFSWVYENPSKLPEIDTLFENDEVFKNLLYLNEYGGDLYTGNSYVSQHIVDSDKKKEYVIAAPPMTYSIYNIHADMVEAEGKPIQESIKFKQKVSELQTTLSQAGVNINLSDVETNVNSSEQATAELVSDINTKLKETSSDWHEPELVNTQNGFEIMIKSDPVKWIKECMQKQEIPGEFYKMQINALENWKYAIFSVTLQDTGKYYIISYDTKSKEYNINEFKSTREFWSLMKPYYNDRIHPIPALEGYIHSIQFDSRNNRYVKDALVELAKPENQDILSALNSYLEARLINEEC